jgi:hypothetical protein
MGRQAKNKKKTANASKARWAGHVVMKVTPKKRAYKKKKIGPLMILHQIPAEKTSDQKDVSGTSSNSTSNSTIPGIIKYDKERSFYGQLYNN